MAKSQRWQKTALAAAAGAAFALWCNTASALALGQITVLSTLGEPLRAEVDIPEMNADEQASLRTGVAAPEAFRQAGLEYNPIMTTLQVTLQRKADGRPYLRISSLRTINDPYIDLVLEARWSSGRIVSSYTMLIDPPNLQLQAVTPTLPQPSNTQPVAPAVVSTPVPPTPPVAATPPEPPAPAEPLATPVTTAAVEPSQLINPADREPVTAAVPEPVNAQPSVSPEQERAMTPPAEEMPATKESQPAAESTTPPSKPSAPPASARAAKPAKTPTPAGPKRVTVKAGDTASKIAIAHLLPLGVSLDQVLVAMLRANPDAVINGNINLIRSGAVLTLPTAQQIQGVSRNEARQILIAQSKDFNAYRQKLAGHAPATQVDSADRRASGKVQAQVEDSKPANAAPDKLTLSKGDIKSSKTQATSPEDKIAKALSAKDTNRQAENTARNIEELDKLAVAAGASAPPASTNKESPPLAAPAVKAPPPAAGSSTQVAPGSKPAAATTAPAKRAAVPTPPPPEPDLMDELLDNPMIPVAAGGLVVLMGGLAFYRIRQRRKSESFIDSTME